MMKYIFIDTNIYLSLYHFTDDDLSKLQALVDFRSAKRIDVIVNKQLVDEFKRNREVRVQDALSTFSPPSVGKVPRLFDQYKTQSKALRKLIRQANELHIELITNVKKDLISHKLKADILIEKLHAGAEETRNNKVLYEAKERVAVGNPPGKNGSLGDAYHWEYLLANVPETQELIIVTADKDWLSPVDDFRLNEYLLLEWATKKNSGIKFYRSIRDYFKAEHPDIKLEGEYGKDIWIESLEESDSFNYSRLALKRIQYLGDLTDDQKRKLVKACTENSQVFKAHEYSPSSIGGRLWEIIGEEMPLTVDKENWNDFCIKFEMPHLEEASDNNYSEPDSDDVPF